MVLRENGVVLLLFPLLHVDEGVAGTSHQHCRCTLIERVVRDLEVADASLNVALTPNACLGNQLLTVPVPQEDLPVGLSGEGYNHLLILGTECTGNELLRVVRIDVLDLLRESLLQFLTLDVIDAEVALVSSRGALAN